MVGEVKSYLESNPIPARDVQRAQTYLVRTRTQRPHREWVRTAFGCLLRRYGSAGDCFRGRGSGCSRPGVWQKPSWRRSPLTHHKAARTYTGLGKQTLGGHKQNQDPGERSSDSTRDWPRLARECPGASGRVVKWWGPAAGLGALSVAVLEWNLLKEATIIFISLASGQITRRGHNPTLQEKIGLKIYWAWPCPS